MHKQEVKDAVRSAYIRDGVPLNQAAARHNVAIGTVRRWRDAAKKRGDDWDEARNAHRLIQSGSSEVVASFLDDFVFIYHATVKSLREQLESGNFDPIQSADALAKMSDSFTKTMSAIQKGKPTTSKLAVAFDVLELFTKWIRDHEPDLANKWIEIIEPFSRHLTEEMGS